VSVALHQYFLQMEARLDQARMRADAEVFEDVLADDFRSTNLIGAVLDKAASLADIRFGAMTVSSSRTGEVTVRVLDDTAIIHGRAHLRARYRGHDISGVYAYTHVYALRGDRWRVVAAHSSRTMPGWMFMVLVRLTNLLRAPGV